MQVFLFVLGLLGFLFGVGFITVLTMGRLNQRITSQQYHLVERAIIGGIMLGIIGMFQPWNVGGLRPGFLLLFVCTLLYVVWSHVVPASDDMPNG